MIIKTYEVAAKGVTSKGTFDAVVVFNDPNGDSDNERIDSWEPLPGAVPLDFQHLSEHGFPAGVVGLAYPQLKSDGRTMTVAGQLQLGSEISDAVYERMTRESSDPEALTALSVAFSYDPSLVTTDPNGVRVIHKARLRSIAVVRAGAQRTAILSVKESSWKSEIDSYEAQLSALVAPRPDADLVAALDAISPPTPTQQDRAALISALDSRAEAERIRRGVADERYVGAYSPEDLNRPVTMSEARAEIAEAGVFRMPSDGFVAYEPIDLEDAEVEARRLAPDEHVQLERQAEAIVADVNRRQAEAERWTGAGVFDAARALAPAERPQPEDDTPLRLPIPS